MSGAAKQHTTTRARASLLAELKRAQSLIGHECPGVSRLAQAVEGTLLWMLFPEDRAHKAPTKSLASLSEWLASDLAEPPWPERLAKRRARRLAGPGARHA